MQSMKTEVFNFSHFLCVMGWYYRNKRFCLLVALECESFLETYSLYMRDIIIYFPGYFILTICTPPLYIEVERYSNETIFDDSNTYFDIFIFNKKRKCCTREVQA